MQKNNDEPRVYLIPPNFIDTGTILGGTFKLRNAIEAIIVCAAIIYFVFNLSLSLKTTLITLCITAIPAFVFILIGCNGESLSSFIINWFKFIKNRRVVGKTKSSDVGFDDKKTNRNIIKTITEHIVTVTKSTNVIVKSKKEWIMIKNEVANYLPIKDAKNGIIYTKDGRYLKIIEVTPINFLLRSVGEQNNIIYSFISYLKICPTRMQFKIVSKNADIKKHINNIKKDMQNEPNARCRELQKDSINLIERIGSIDAVTRHFYIVFEYSPGYGTRSSEKDAISQLHTVVRNATNYLKNCGNEVIINEHDDEFAAEVFYSILNRKSSQKITLEERANNVIQDYIENGWDVSDIPMPNFISPCGIDFSHHNHIKIDNTYYAYLFIPADGYKTRVMAGWMSLLINAYEGVDLDIFLEKQPKDRIKQKIGQQIRINRSKLNDTNDTADDFDSLSSSIHAGYYLKNGLSNNEDFYYLNILITVSADNLKLLYWKIHELKKLLISQDLEVQQCLFRQEQAFLSSLPLCQLDKTLFNYSKRNVLTSGAGSIYPLVSYELCDDNGILLGINTFNNSLIAIDSFNSRIYKNANIVIAGTSGAGKTFTLQLMALRMRCKDIQVFIIAPLKGHEMYRACQNIGGEFIQISPGSPHCINIMEIRKVDKINTELIDGPTLEISALASKIQQLHIFFSLLIPDMSYEERQLLDEVLVKTYECYGINHDNASLVDPENPDKYKEMPVLGDVYDLLVTKSETKRLANILNRLVHGSAKTFNQRTNVDLFNKYTVLDISELSGDLLTIGMFVALDYVWDKTKEDRTKRKAIFIDECWKLIGASSNELAAEFVLEIFKIIRGYGGAAIAATQDLSDFFALADGKYGRGIINNSKTKIVLNLEDDEAQIVRNTLNLSETEYMNITHFQRGYGLLSTNNNNVTIEFKASDLEKELITTDRQELEEIIKRKKQTFE